MALSSLDDKAACGPVTEDWSFSGAKYGWILRLKRKKRVVLYLIPLPQHLRNYRPGLLDPVVVQLQPVGREDGSEKVVGRLEGLERYRDDVEGCRSRVVDQPVEPRPSARTNSAAASISLWIVTSRRMDFTFSIPSRRSRSAGLRAPA